MQKSRYTRTTIHCQRWSYFQKILQNSIRMYSLLQFIVSFGTIGFCYVTDCVTCRETQVPRFKDVYENNKKDYETSYITHSFKHPMVFSIPNQKKTYVFSKGLYNEESSMNTLSFKLPRTLFHSQLIDAQLIFRVTENSSIKETYLTNNQSHLRFMKKKMNGIRLGKYGYNWLKFDFKRAFYKQKRHLTLNGLLLHREPIFLKVEVHCSGKREAEKQNQSFLELVTPKREKRHKRSDRHYLRECVPGQTTCCLRSLEFDFSDFGINNVIYPNKGMYKINYCQGTCPKKKVDYSSDREHSKSTTNLNLNEEPCCVATQFESLNLLYIEQKKVTSRMMERFSARKCECL